MFLLALADSAGAFVAGRFAVGIVGAAFVVTQYHMSLMFAPRVLGAANALTAGWGNLGGGLAQVLMPLLLSGTLAAGVAKDAAWRIALMVPGILLSLCALAYWRWTQDTPHGDWEIAHGFSFSRPKGAWYGLRTVATDVRT